MRTSNEQSFIHWENFFSQFFFHEKWFFKSYFEITRKKFVKKQLEKKMKRKFEMKIYGIKITNFIKKNKKLKKILKNGKNLKFLIQSICKAINREKTSYKSVWISWEVRWIIFSSKC